MNALHELSVPRSVNISNKVTKPFAKGVARRSKYPYIFLGGGLWFVNIVDYLPCVKITKYALGFCCFPILSALCHHCNN
jgi:hypothetical protein